MKLALADAEQFDLRPVRHEAFDGGQHLHEVPTVGCHQANTELGAPVLTVVPTSATEISKRRLSSARRGRTTERFSFRLCTSPRRMSNSLHPIHMLHAIECSVPAV
ncbi:hypothetical protein QFZ60_003545 [Arthrobacter sp. B2I5]|nr:hypothetical protein [Arthrobacter sp. B2I5]